MIEQAEDNVLREQEEMTQEDNIRVSYQGPRGDLPMRLRAEAKIHPVRSRTERRGRARRRRRS